MIPAKYQPDQKPLSALVSTLEGVFRPDPVIPDSMLALLRLLEETPALIAAGALTAPAAMHP